jgi:anti-sigma regulatory factor (Ser/Thr protein kinase)
MPGATTATALAPRSRPRLRPRHRATLALGQDPARVGHARRTVRALLAQWQLNHVTDPALLVLTELLGNALRHAPGPATGLTVTADPTALLIEVHDSSPQPPAVKADADPYAETGRGLPLVHAMSHDWGWTPHQDQTKTVWALLSIPPT